METEKKLEEYKKILENIRINSINLNDLNLKKIANVVNEELINVNVEVEFSIDNYIIENSKKLLTVFTTFKLMICDDTGNKIAEICFCYEVIYMWKYDFDMSDEIAKLFIGVNTQMHVWPYGRELISSITTRMGYPALVIEPFIRENYER